MTPKQLKSFSRLVSREADKRGTNTYDMTQEEFNQWLRSIINDTK